MDAQTLSHVNDPFFTTRTSRHVGLGLPLFRAAAQRCNGDLVVTSQPGVGTRVVVTFERDHIDRAPMGDIKSTLLCVILAAPRGDGRKAAEVHYRHSVRDPQSNCRTFEFDTEQMRQVLGGVPLTHPQVRTWLEDFLNEGFAELSRSAPRDVTRSANGSV